MKKFLSTVFAVGMSIFFASCSKSKEEADSILDIGFFPNVTHAQAVIAYELTQQGNGWFERYIDNDVKIVWSIFNAGPSAMTSIFSDALDMTYVGPTPAINSYIKSEGVNVRVIAGAANGGSGLVVSPDVAYKDPSSLKGKIIATPQFANTQDVSCKTWLMKNSLTLNKGAGGDVKVLPVGNPEQLPLMTAGEINAAWTVEPWISILEEKAGGNLVVKEENAVTTILVSSAPFMKNNSKLVGQVRRAHIELTNWINEHPEEAKALVLQGLKRLRNSTFSESIVDKSFSRIKFTSEVNKDSIMQFVEDGKKCGLIKTDIDMSGFFADFDSKPKN